MTTDPTDNRLHKPGVAGSSPAAAISYEPAEVYFDGPSWAARTNCSSLKELDASAVGYYRRYVAKTAPPKTSAAFDLGKLLHTWAEVIDGLDPTPFWRRVHAAPAAHVTATGQLAKSAAEWIATLPADAIPMAPAVKSSLEAQTEELLRNPAVVDLLLEVKQREFNIAFSIGSHECKCRVDGATSDFAFDWKTTRDTDPHDTFDFAAADFRYDLQAAFYLLGLMQAGWPRHRMRFIATSTTYPHHNCVMVLPQGVQDAAERRVHELLRELDQRRVLDWWTPTYYGEVVEMKSRRFAKGGRGW
jgi:hypothetical protein